MQEALNNRLNNLVTKELQEYIRTKLELLTKTIILTFDGHNLNPC